MKKKNLKCPKNITNFHSLSIRYLEKIYRTSWRWLYTVASQAKQCRDKLVEQFWDASHLFDLYVQAIIEQHGYELSMIQAIVKQFSYNIPTA